MTGPDFAAIRRNSLELAAKLRLRPSATLPLSDYVAIRRPAQEVATRAACLYCVVALAHGVEPARKWIRESGLTEALTPREKLFIADSGTSNDTSHYRGAEEGLWVLAWALLLLPSIDLARPCDARLARLFPQPTSRGAVELFVATARLRSFEEIAAIGDALFVIDWCARKLELSGKRTPQERYVIRERRNAIEWILGVEAYDEVPLDT